MKPFIYLVALSTLVSLMTVISDASPIKPKKSKKKAKSVAELGIRIGGFLVHPPTYPLNLHKYKKARHPRRWTCMQECNKIGIQKIKSFTSKYKPEVKDIDAPIPAPANYTAEHLPKFRGSETETNEMRAKF